MKNVLREFGLILQPGPVTVLAAEEGNEGTEGTEATEGIEDTRDGSAGAGAEGAETIVGGSDSVDHTIELLLQDVIREGSVSVDIGGAERQLKSMANQMAIQNVLFLLLITVLILLKMKSSVWSLFRGARKKREERRNKNDSIIEDGEKEGGEETWENEDRSYPKVPRQIPGHSEKQFKDELDEVNKDSQSAGHSPSQDYYNNLIIKDPQSGIQGSGSDRNPISTSERQVDRQWIAWLSLDRKNTFGGAALLRSDTEKNSPYCLFNDNTVELSGSRMNCPNNANYFIKLGIPSMFELKQERGGPVSLSNLSYESNIVLKSIEKPAQVEASGNDWLLKNKGILLVEVQ